MAVAAEPLRAWDTSVARPQKTLPVVQAELTLCRTNPHPAVRAVSCAKGSTTKGRLAGPTDGEMVM